jgi:hypothetical protein
MFEQRSGPFQSPDFHEASKGARPGPERLDLDSSPRTAAARSGHATCALRAAGAFDGLGDGTSAMLASAPTDYAHPLILAAVLIPARNAHHIISPV